MKTTNSPDEVVTRQSTNAEMSPHLDYSEVKQKLTQLESAVDQQRIDIMTELAWRPAWAIRSRSGVLALFSSWLKNRRNSVPGDS